VDWILANKEWLFSGLLVAVPIALIGWFIARKQFHRSQVQKSGNRSINIQAGGNVKLGGDTSDERSDTKDRR
jgi:hypothetical protein